MKTIVLGICEVNNRQHFCGIWPDMETVKTELVGAYDVSRCASDKIGLPYNAIETWEAIDTGLTGNARDTLPSTFKGHIGIDTDGFTLYVIDIVNLPGYMPFDED